MPLHHGGQGGLSGVVIIRTAGGLESFEELTVRQAHQGTDLVQDPEISEHGASAPPGPASRGSRSTTIRNGPYLLDHHGNKGATR